jgi:hypothetical protein
MATTISTAARNAACNAIVDLLDDGGGAGKLVIQTSGDATLATLTLAATSFGAAATGVATAATISAQNATGTGTAAKFIATDSADATVISGSVTATGGGGDITLDSLSIESGQSVEITSWTVTMPAS